MIDYAAQAPLVEQAKSGDQVAIQRLLDTVLADGFRLAVAMLHDPAEAEDTVQEAAVKAWSRIAQHRSGTEFRPWFLGIVANECRMVRRGRWFSLIRQAEPRATDIAGPGLARDLDLQTALRALPSQDRYPLRSMESLTSCVSGSPSSLLVVYAQVDQTEKGMVASPSATESPSGVTYGSTDGGLTWFSIAASPDMCVDVLDAHDAVVLGAPASGDHETALNVTTDAGQHWSSHVLQMPPLPAEYRAAFTPWHASQVSFLSATVGWMSVVSTRKLACHHIRRSGRAPASLRPCGRSSAPTMAERRGRRCPPPGWSRTLRPPATPPRPGSIVRPPRADAQTNCARIRAGSGTRVPGACRRTPSR